MKAKTDVNGNVVILNKNLLSFYNNGECFKVTAYLDEASAKQEFNRVTNSYRGCGKNIWRRRESMKRWYFYIPL